MLRFLCCGGFLCCVRLFLWGCFGLRLCLSFCLFLLDFRKMSVNGFNQLCSGAFDDFKRAFQLGKLPSAAPPGDIAERIIRRVKPVMLADGKGDTFSLYLAGAAVGAFRRVDSGIMQRRMSDFMDSSLDIL